MDKITVAELATECSVKNDVVLAELKRLGLYVFLPTATIDVNFADTIRKKILFQKEAEGTKTAEAERKKESDTAKKSVKKTDAKTAKKTGVAVTDTAKSARPAAASKEKPPQKKTAKAEEVKTEEVKPKISMAPRKGRKHYDRKTEELVDQPAVKLDEITADTISSEAV
ncbi:MAG TPA: hypothetical protein VLL97_00495, partial [Acidobacteriota bacterium]|nr:hypothetical protein [Acidobacteriota bacterium]